MEGGLESASGCSSQLAGDARFGSGRRQAASYGIGVSTRRAGLGPPSFQAVTAGRREPALHSVSTKATHPVGCRRQLTIVKARRGSTQALGRALNSLEAV